MDELRTAYQLTERDMYEALKAHSGSLGKFMPLGGCALILTSSYFLLEQHRTAFGSLNWLVGIAFGLYIIFWTRINARLLYRKENRSGERAMVVNDQGLELSAITGANQTRWASFVRFKEAENLFLVYPEWNRFYTIPKRALQPFSTDRFRKLLQTNVSEQRPGFTSQRLVVAFVIVTSTALVIFAALR